MSFPRYPRYKDSGVEWLGQVPEQWELRPLKYLVQLRGGLTPSKEKREYWDGSIPWASSKDLKGSELADTEDHLSQRVLDDGVTELQPAGSILVTVRGMILARTFPVVTTCVPTAINQDLKALTSLGRLRGGFLAWLLRGTASETLARVDEAAHGTKVLRVDSWASMLMPVPPLSDQDVIMAFLDRETAKVDALVAEQERLIDLLKEKREAVISHVVTKGLNPGAPMKPSGNEWMGEVPAHWSCVRNKAVFAEVDDRADAEDGELMTVSHITGVTPRSEKDVSMFLAETLAGYKKCKRGDLVINTMWAWMGALGCSPCDGLVSPSYNVYRPRGRETLSSEFYDFLCRTPMHRVVIKANSTGVWESRLRLYPERFLSMGVALPPLVEQGKIARFLQDAEAKWLALAAEAERTISLLQERRTALISAAVTGQIDVRGFAPKEPAA